MYGDLLEQRLEAFGRRAAERGRRRLGGLERLGRDGTREVRELAEQERGELGDVELRLGG